MGGDDFAYGFLVHDILKDGYPAVGPNVFAARPVLMLPIAAGIALLGWTEWAMVLPVFLGSLAGIACTYALGRLALGRATAVCAAVTLAVLPLDLVYATTTTNDILGSAVLAMAALLAWLAISSTSHGARSSVLALASGVVFGLALGVKLSMILGILSLLSIIGLIAVAYRQWRIALVIAVGFVLAHVLLMLFFWYTSGDVWANYRVEIGFSQMFMAEGYLAARFDALLAYPGWAFGIRPAVPDVDRFFPYGLLFPAAIVSIALLLWWKVRRMWPVALWFVTVVLLVQFWPLQVFPYIPIHRLPRFMHLAAIPGALLVGATVASAISRGVLLRFGAIALWLVYLGFGVVSSVTAAARHHDSMQDLRLAADLSARFPGLVITDAEMRGYLMFRRGFEDLDPLRKVLGAQVIVPPRSLVIFGGSRRIDVDPGWPDTRIPESIPEDWIKLADLPGMPRPWRRSRGAAYVSNLAAKVRGKGFQSQIGASKCGDGSWHLVDVIDVGERGSEHEHRYQIEDQRFAGERMLYSSEEGELEEDGRSFVRSQSFDALRLAPNRPVCIVKRIDPGARRQTSRLQIDGTTVATLTADQENVTKWLDVAVVVAGPWTAESPMRITEQFVSADIDVNCFRVEIYQRAPGAESQ